VSGKTLVGVYNEERGEDRYAVYKSDGDEVVQVVHYDALGVYGKVQSINFWSAEAPALIALIEKAAGIKKPRVSYEYAVLQRDESSGLETLVTAIRIWNDDKSTQQRMAKLFNDTMDLDENGNPLYTYKVVRREKPKGYEEVKD